MLLIIRVCGMINVKIKVIINIDRSNNMHKDKTEIVVRSHIL